MSKSPSLEQVIEVASAMMARVEAQAYSDERFSELTLRQILYLTRIIEGGGLTPGALADSLGVTPPTVTGVVGGLVSRGYVERTKDTTDRRVVHLVATKKAQAFDRLHHEIHRRMAAVMAGNLSEKECAQLARLLDKALSGLSSE
ncbi:MAG: MarR family transcriptional regulator [Fibrobacteres bacterium]|jgi:DNA-binding MarR family transcriptional regulator|nr:MarR family transcriptional regulator [Fibrobacterota bacterium]